MRSNDSRALRRSATAPFIVALGLLVGCGGERSSTAAPETARNEAPDETGEGEGEAETTQSPLVDQARTALSDCEGAGAFLDLWDGLDGTERRTLAESDDLSVALQARWELERSVPPSDETPQGLDLEGIDRFLAFVAERAGGQPPEWWAQTLRDARYHPSTATTSYNDVQRRLDEEYQQERPIDGLTVHTRGSLSVVDSPTADRMFIIGEGGAVRPPVPAAGPRHRVVSRPSHELPLAALQRETNSPHVYIAALQSRAHSIVLPYEPASGGFATTVRRYDDGRPVWEQRVCGGGRTILGGRGTQLLELAPRAGGLVLVFGAESHAVFLDALRIEDGSLAFRFNTDLWFARHGRAGTPAENRGVPCCPG